MSDWVQLSELIHNVGIVVGGGIGLAFAWMRVRAANRQFRRAGQMGRAGQKGACRGAVQPCCDSWTTNLKGTILRGANLSGARNLTWEQLAEAIIDDTTVLPEHLRAEALAASAGR